MYSITQAKRIQEIADYGTAKQHLLPEGEGTGLIWRLFSVSRLEERDDGLYIETEAMALSRDIPSALRLLMEPIVRRVSREALETALRQTANAARAFRAHPPSALPIIDRQSTSPFAIPYIPAVEFLPIFLDGNHHNAPPRRMSCMLRTIGRSAFHQFAQ